MSDSNKKILIAYTSIFGYVQEIAEKIAAALNEEGIDTQLLNLTTTKSKDIPSIQGFNGIITGSYSHPFQKEYNKVSKDYDKIYKPNLKTLQKRDIILGQFINSPFLFPKTFEFVENQIQKRGIRRIKIEVNLWAGFCPVIDFSNTSKLNKEEIKYLRDFAKTLSKELNIECDPNGYNDFREWDRVKEFAHRFAELVKNKA